MCAAIALYNLGWVNLGGKQAPTNGVPKILKKVCVVNLKDGVELNLAVSCVKDDASVRLVPMSCVTTLSDKKETTSEQYVGLFETRTSRENNKSKGYDGNKCYVKTATKISDTCMEIHLVWSGNQFSRLYVQVYDGSRIGVYEKPNMEDRMVTKIDLTNGKPELFGVEV